jgi:dTDP-4-dehydrorhamnose reductase
MIGSYLGRYFDDLNYDVETTTRKIYSNNGKNYLDLSTDSQLLSDKTFEVAVFCAGITQMSICEEFPTMAKIVNVDNTIGMIQKLLLQKTHVIFLSSNKVFNGIKQFNDYYDIVSPTNNYGEYKVMVEEKFFDPNFSVLRLSKVLTREAPFLKRWKAALILGMKLEISKNEFLSPVTLDQVACAVNQIINEKADGMFQLGSKVETSYYDFATNYFSNNKKFLDLLVGVNSLNGANKYNSLRTYLPD